DGHRFGLVRPIAANLDDITGAGLLDRVDQGLEFALGDALAAQDDERAGLCRWSLGAGLFRVLEPLLIFRRRLPALVGGAGAVQVHVGAEVLAVLARLVASAVGAEAEVLGRQLIGGGCIPLVEIATGVMNRALNHVRRISAPEPFPAGQRAG